MFEGVTNTELSINNNNNRQNMEGCNIEFPSNKIYMQINFVCFSIKISPTEHCLYVCFYKKTNHIKLL